MKNGILENKYKLTNKATGLSVEVDYQGLISYFGYIDGAFIYCDLLDDDEIETKYFKIKVIERGL